jgi:hypothetical protein
MDEEQDATEEGSGSRPHGAMNVGAFLLSFLFVWLVFDNFALALLAGLAFGGGSEIAQRATDKPD